MRAYRGLPREDRPGTRIAPFPRMRTNRPARLKTFSYVGIHRYSLTFCTDFRNRYFENAAVVQLVLAQFVRVADREVRLWDRRPAILRSSLRDWGKHAIGLSNVEPMRKRLS